jgi:hypothetical protein
MNASLLQQLGSALRERLRVIADHELRDSDPATHLKKLQEASEAIEVCEAALSESKIDPKLRHYLAQRSYDKALASVDALL